ncbi:MAG TPA: hypothetical protein VFY10_15260 [Dehalococcoidia bacterium]|nr:hypothetical protein [Dehalococcoidia bacterium]
MLDAYLAGSGGRVVIPDAVGIMGGDESEDVRFVDAAGRTLVVFKRYDLIMYTDDGAKFELTDVLQTIDSGDGAT